jgi:hypothetical protein
MQTCGHAVLKDMEKGKDSHTETRNSTKYRRRKF